MTLLPIPCRYLESLPPLALTCSGLTSLDLSCNSLEVLSESIGCHLPALVELDLSFNKLQKLPVSLSRLTRLEVLKSSYNKLASIPSQVGRRSLAGRRVIVPLSKN